MRRDARTHGSGAQNCCFLDSKLHGLPFPEPDWDIKTRGQATKTPAPGQTNYGLVAKAALQLNDNEPTQGEKCPRLARGRQGKIALLGPARRAKTQGTPARRPGAGRRVCARHRAYWSLTDFARGWHTHRCRRRHQRWRAHRRGLLRWYATRGNGGDRRGGYLGRVLP